MSPDLKTLMKRSAPEPARKVDIDAIAGRSRSLLWRGRLLTVSTTIVLGLTALFFLSATNPGSGGEENNGPNRPADQGPDQTSPGITNEDRAASFAIRALTENDLRDPMHDYFDYVDLDEGPARSDDTQRWIATFEGPECTEYNGRPCIDIDGTPPSLTVEVDRDRMTVVDASGPLEKWSDRLVGFAGAIAKDPPQFVWNVSYVASRSSDAETHLAASSYWTGPIPANYYSECEVHSGDWKSGDRGVGLYTNSPRREAERDDLVGIVTERKIHPETMEIECEPIRNLDEQTYEMPDVADELQPVSVGSDVIVPSDTERAPEKKQQHSHDNLPTGPRYVVARGTFDEGEWGDYEGQNWWFVAWENEQWTCEEFEVGNLESDGEGWGCNGREGEADEVIWSIAFDPGGKEQLSVVHGVLRDDVDRIDFELSSGSLVTVDSIEPPEEMSGDRRYFIAYLPPTENGYVVARDAEGNELHRERLCHASCFEIGESVD